MSQSGLYEAAAQQATMHEPLAETVTEEPGEAPVPPGARDPARIRCRCSRWEKWQQVRRTEPVKLHCRFRVPGCEPRAAGQGSCKVHDISACV